MKEIDRMEFGNGLVLLTEERPYTKKAALLVGVGVGSVNENEKISGGSHFNEHLLFKSNNFRSAREIIEDLEYTGTVVNAGTSWRYTAFYAKTPYRELENAIEILFQASTNLEYDEEEFELERKVILTEILNYMNSPEKYALMGLFIPTLFSGTLMERKIEGTTETMDSVRKRDLEKFKKRFYAPNNMIIAVCGRFNKSELVDVVESTFGGLGKKPVRGIGKIDIRNKRILREEGRGDINQSYLGLGYRVPGYSSEDFFRLDLLSSILSEGLSSRMFHELRERRGIGYSVGNFFHPLGGEGMFVSHVDGFDPGRVDETREVILGIFDDLKKRRLTTREFKGTKKLMISKYDDLLEKITERAMMIFQSEFFKIPFDFRERERFIREVSREDIQYAAERYLSEDYVMTVLNPVHTD
jgi:predicted Zn-dependent peptidase